MIKLIILLNKRSDITQQQFLSHWRDTHKPIVTQLPGLRRYVQSRPCQANLPFPSAFDGVAELWFDSVEAMEQAMSSPQEKVAKEDAHKFINLDTSSMLVVSELTPE